MTNERAWTEYFESPHHDLVTEPSPPFMGHKDNPNKLKLYVS